MNKNQLFFILITLAPFVLKAEPVSPILETVQTTPALSTTQAPQINKGASLYAPEDKPKDKSSKKSKKSKDVEVADTAKPAPTPAPTPQPLQAEQTYSVTGPQGNAQNNATDELMTLDLADYASSPFTSPDWDSEANAGIKAYHQGDSDKAHENLYKATAKGCESPILLFMLAVVSEQRGNYYSALDYYESAKKGFGTTHQNHRFAKMLDENYGRALITAGKPSQGLALLEQSAKKNPKFWVLKLLGVQAYSAGDSNGALSYFERAIRTNEPDVSAAERAELYLLQGRLFLQMGQNDGALRSYQKVLEIAPDQPEAKKVTESLGKEYQQDKMMELMNTLNQ